MARKVWLAVSATLGLAACGAGGPGGGGAGGPFVVLPEAVSAIAAPYQDLTAVRLNPEDGCYEYRHVGPVETTFLPLRASNGRPICTRAPDEAPAKKA